MADEYTTEQIEELARNAKLAMKIGAEEDKVRTMDKVYVMKSTESTGKTYYKIGISFNPESRLENVRTSNPLPTDILFAIPCEQGKEIEESLHDKYKSKRVFREWFDLDDQDIEDIKGILETYGYQHNNISVTTEG